MREVRGKRVAQELVWSWHSSTDTVSLQQFIPAEDTPQVGEVSFLISDSKSNLELSQIFWILITGICFHALTFPLASPWKGDLLVSDCAAQRLSWNITAHSFVGTQLGF